MRYNRVFADIATATNSHKTASLVFKAKSSMVASRLYSGTTSKPVFNPRTALTVVIRNQISGHPHVLGFSVLFPAE
jgi:hypothetical protein